MKKTSFFLFILITFSTFAQVPSNCTDVMLQGYYWESYKTGSIYGDTRWTTLNEQASEIASSFDLIWLPPSAKASDGTGYHPKEWSNQTSKWGTSTQLKALIQELHSNGTKVIADIVINHRDGNYNWTDFCNENFGSYGFFTLYPGEPFICQDDECKPNHGDNPTGAPDAGYETNCGASGGYCASRDLDHSNATLQNAIKAYLQWMKGEMGYDGWRYDLVKGYLGKYNKMYNDASLPYLSIGEYFDGDIARVKHWIEETSMSSAAFDFPAKFSIFNNALAKGNYTSMATSQDLPKGLCGDSDWKRYAITFIDNHDTFRDGNRYTGNIPQAYAVLLATPGIPCIFYGHWSGHKADIQQMIASRKAMGIHSQSACSTSGTCSSYYQSTIVGSLGTLICFVGNGWDAPQGYTLQCSGEGWAYYTRNHSSGIDSINEDNPTIYKKVLENGSIHILSNEKRYSVLGQEEK